MTTKITNEMLYELLKEFKADSNRQFAGIREELHDIKAEQRDFRRRMESVESKIDHIQISWSTRLVIGVLGASAVTSAFVAGFITSIIS